MSISMKNEMVKDIEKSIEIMKRHPEEMYWLYFDHSWIGKILDIDLDTSIDSETPEIKYKDLQPLLEKILKKLKDSDPDSEYINGIYISPAWCSIENFLLEEEDEEEF